jgi:uncharacterized protein Yka (UPF0111/DUF47 family)
MHSHLKESEELELREYVEEVERLEKECDRYADLLVARMVKAHFTSLSDFSNHHSDR